MYSHGLLQYRCRCWSVIFPHALLLQWCLHGFYGHGKSGKVRENRSTRVQ